MADGTVYRQIARKMTLPGRESIRPFDKISGAYTDLETPTLITIYPDDPIDVDFAIRTGAIQPYTPPGKARPGKGGEVGEVK